MNPQPTSTWRPHGAMPPGHSRTQCALWTPEESVSYSELAAQVEHLAACLDEAGIRRGHTIASILWTRKHLAVVLLALARLGAINVPLDPALPKNRLLSILEDAGPLFILSDDPAACADFSLPCITIDGTTGKILHRGIS